MTLDRGPGDRYIVKRLLGEGGAGRVSLVEDRQRPGHELALKQLSEAGSVQHEEAFRREFATLACLHHPSLVEVEEFDTSPESGLPRFTLEFVAGRDIVAAVRSEGHGLLLDLTVEALRALAFIHQFDLIHRDLKPGNLLVRDTPKLGCRLVIVDFGLALKTEGDPVDAFRVAGTFPYLAPELLENRGVSRRTDLYALGAVLREIGPLRGGYPRGFPGWLAGLVSHDPADRPADATEALARLNESCGTSYPTETRATRAARLLSGPPAERAPDLEHIRSALSGPHGPRVVWVCGGPGSGKSRLLRWLEAEAILRGTKVVTSLRGLGVDPDASTPALVLLDEAHAAGGETFQLIERVARGADAPPIQIVAAIRPEAIADPAMRSLIAATGTVPTLRRVDLGRLDEQGARAMAERATGGAVSEERVAWLTATCDGSPALAETLLVEGVWERGGEASRIAPPWSDAGENERAREALLRAAEERERAGDPAGAASHFASALRLLGRSRESRHGLRVRQADALARAGRYRAAAKAAAAAARLAPDLRARTEARELQAFALVQAGQFHRALALAEAAAAGAIEAGDRRCLARARRTAGIGLGRLGRETDAIPLLHEARQLFAESGDARGEADALHALAACRARLSDPSAARDFEEAIALYRAARALDGLDPPDAQDLKAQVGLAVVRSRAGSYDEAGTILESVHAAAVARGAASVREIALSKMVMNAIDLGKLDRAIVLAEQAADLAMHLGDHNLIVVNRCGVSDARIRCGRAGEAVSNLRQTLDMPLDRVEPEIIDYARMLLADAWMEAGGADDREIGDLLARSLAGCRERGKRRAWLMGLVIEMERRARPDAREPFAVVRAEFDSLSGRDGEPVEPEIAIRAALATAAHHIARGEPERGRTFAAAAVEAASAAGYLAFSARATAVLAGALLAAGHEREADAAVEDGRRLLDRAAERIEDPRIRADFIARPVYAGLRAHVPADARRGHTRLLTLYDMIRVLNSEPDADGLLETILDLALRAVDAERGLVFLKEEREGPGQGAFSVHVSRNLERETVRDAETFSRRIVEEAGRGRSLLALDAGNDDRFRNLASVSLYQIRSLMCVPLRSRGRVIGTVYLDSRKDGRLFTQDDLRFVEALADQAALAIENARLRVRLERENRQLADAAEARTSFANLVGRSPGIRAVFALIEKVAGTDLPVLIRGESGTGKELVARAIHVHGPRRRRAFLGENCAAIPETLLETELFGHVRGAFTGAERAHPGLFEQADGGTLFLDEVGDMAPAMQVRLLRVVEEGAIRRVGAEKPIPVNVRLITATHRDLQAEVKVGRFRLDLLYRLQVMTIEIPPLRERPGDIALLTSHILARIAAERGRAAAVVDAGALGLFERYGWPGNVRELQNTLQRLSLLAGDRSITPALIESDPVLRRTLIPAVESGKTTYSLKSGEKTQLRQAIAAAGGVRRNAADLLGISRATLYRKLKRHGL